MNGAPLTWPKRGGVFALCFAALLALHGSALRAPPTPDQIVGIWTEGAFLAETRFDYSRLFWQEPPASRGGPRTYMFSVLPSVLALLMTILDDPGQVIVAYHLFCLACAAVTLTLLFELLLANAGPAGAALACAAAATTPLFSVQAELAGMEMPLAACTTLALYLVARDRYLGATFACVAAFFIKSNALVLLVVHLGCVLLRLLWRRDCSMPSSVRRLVCVAGANVVLIAALGAVHFLGVLT